MTVGETEENRLIIEAYIIHIEATHIIIRIINIIIKINIDFGRLEITDIILILLCIKQNISLLLVKELTVQPMIALIGVRIRINQKMSSIIKQ
jgi:hypothetical protein